MESRKVQKVSQGTLVISLPKQWAVRHHVKQGTILSMRENAAGSLVVEPHLLKVENKVPYIHDGETLEPSIIASYIMGASSIVITNATLAIRARTLTQLQELPGLEVSDETNTTITLKCLLDMEELKFPTILDRLCVLLKYGVALATAGNRTALLQNEIEINRNYHLAQRMLTRAAYDNVFLRQIGIPLARLIPAYQLLVKRLEHAGDSLRDLPEKLTDGVRKDVAAAIDMICEMIRHHTAGKSSTAQLPTYERINALRKNQTNPQVLFLIRTTNDVREELIMLRMGHHIFGDLLN
jgi:phosphate uptake regulator